MYRVVTNNKSVNIIRAKASMIAESGNEYLQFHTKQLGNMTVVYTLK